MNSVVLTEINSIMPAMTWANKRFGNRYTWDNQFPSKRWTFKFNNPEHATLFALKWS